MEEVLKRLRVAVIGTGLIGGSILTKVHNLGLDAVGWDPDPETRSYGLDRGLRYSATLQDALTHRTLVFVCSPLGVLPETIEYVLGNSRKDCLVTDVGSTKGHIAESVHAAGFSSRFIPGHPLAGSEKSGLAAADPTLFDGAPWVLCPYPRKKLEQFRLLTVLLLKVFRARVVPIEPATHDTAVALSSHIPHLLAAALAGGVGRTRLEPTILGLAAGSFRDGTRVAGTPSATTADMLVSNRVAILSMTALVRTYLSELVEALESVDDVLLVEKLRFAQRVSNDHLDRELVSSSRTFDPSSSNEDEYQFLARVGAIGGFITDCLVRKDAVVYDMLSP